MSESSLAVNTLLSTARRYAEEPAQFGKVAVVMGGWSSEREVSLMGGQQIFEALTSAGVDAHPVDAGRDIAEVLQRERFQRAFLILHGAGGEDGQVQAALDLAGIPYTGSGVLGSALSMDKWRAKQLVRQAGIPTPMAMPVADCAAACAAADSIGFPVVVKPAAAGSSIGVSFVETADEMLAAWELASAYGEVLVEQKMNGREVTATILCGEALPLVSVQAASGFYDYEAKYFADNTRYECPARLPDALTAHIQALALSAFAELGCRDWGRIDFMLDSNDDPQFIECNTAPGMTSHSLVPMAAAALDIDFKALCLVILGATLRSQRREGRRG